MRPPCPSATSRTFALGAGTRLRVADGRNDPRVLILLGSLYRRVVARALSVSQTTFSCARALVRSRQHYGVQIILPALGNASRADKQPSGVSGASGSREIRNSIHQFKANDRTTDMYGSNEYTPVCEDMSWGMDKYGAQGLIMGPRIKRRQARNEHHLFSTRDRDALLSRPDAPVRVCAEPCV